MSRGRFLTVLLAGLVEPSRIPPSVSATGLALDSRRVAPGDLFLAYPGGRQDGRAFISQAVARGAPAIVYEPRDFIYHGRVPGVAVPGLAAQASEIGARFYGRPSERLYVIGVTGTNGKTSCVHFLCQCLERLAVSARMIGTLGSGRVGCPEPGALTTPDPLGLQRRMREFADEGATHVVMEVSSHALSQARVAAVAFDAAVFTNLSRDHLDYHTDIDDYARAKRSLFRWPGLRFAVVNADDPVGRRIIGDATIPVVSFGDNGRLCATEVRTTDTGLALCLQDRDRVLSVATTLVGRVNVANVLAVAAVLLQMGFDPRRLERALNGLSPVPGRMELLRVAGRGAVAVVDYAHTPDALESALKSVREHCRGQLWCVFGCGGDRDRGKRPQMGRAAERWADRVVLTNDNPRGESPDGIVAQIVGGMSAAPRVVLDRRQAIAEALAAAGDADWVLVAGKGHESSQIVGDRAIDFDDRQVVSECLGIRSNGRLMAACGDRGFPEVLA